jgi:hypothetical protein
MSPTKRTWREREGVEFLSAYQVAELTTGEVFYPALKYDGYGDGVGKDLRAFISDLMRTDWARHRAALLSFWVSGQSSAELPNRKPWLYYRGAAGTRPWAWWHLEAGIPQMNPKPGWIFALLPRFDKTAWRRGRRP